MTGVVPETVAPLCGAVSVISEIAGLTAATTVTEPETVLPLVGTVSVTALVASDGNAPAIFSTEVASILRKIDLRLQKNLLFNLSPSAQLKSAYCAKLILLHWADRKVAFSSCL